jgi:hypothetical protein
VTELESLATTSDEHTHKLQESYGNKLKTLESQVGWYPTLLRYNIKCLTELICGLISPLL